MTKQTKPKMFLGVLFSSKVSNVGVFERLLDDAITSPEDLKTDAQGNLNRWLASLPGRLIYTINVALNPFDENGVKLNGTWATLGIGYRTIGGAFKPLDTIPLGPIDPIVYYPKSSETQQIQIELPKQLSAQEISQIEFPSGDIKIVDASGMELPIRIGDGSTVSRPRTAAEAAQTTSEALKAASEAISEASEAAKSIPIPTQPAPSPVVVSPASTLGPGLAPLTTEQIGALQAAAARVQQAPPGELAAAQAALATIQRQLTPVTGIGASIPLTTITVIVNGLAVRSAPNTSAPLTGSQRLNIGDTFLAKGWVRGENVQGIDMWWISQFGNYVWSGGTQEKP